MHLANLLYDEHDTQYVSSGVRVTSDLTLLRTHKAMRLPKKAMLPLAQSVEAACKYQQSWRPTGCCAGWDAIVSSPTRCPAVKPFDACRTNDLACDLDLAKM